MDRITSRDNRRLIDARKVRDGKAPGQIFIEGRRLVEEAIRSDLDLEECFVTENYRDTELLKTIGKRAGSIAELPDRIFGSIAGTEHPQGIIILAKRPVISAGSIESGLESAALPIVIFLMEINNPSNLGAIMRTAEAAGAAGVVVSENSADAFSPKALRAGMGSTFRMPVWEKASFDDVCSWAKERNLTTTAADTAATKSYLETDWKIRRLLIFGSEAHGLNASELGKINEVIRVPMENGVESLNLAVSAAVILFEARRQFLKVFDE